MRYALHLRTLPQLRARLRIAARRSAARYTWRAVVERTMPLFLQGLGVSLPPGAKPAQPSLGVVSRPG